MLAIQCQSNERSCELTAGDQDEVTDGGEGLRFAARAEACAEACAWGTLS